MKAKTINQLAQHIVKRASTGREKQVNESLHFGMGLYIYKEDAYLLQEANRKEGRNSAFTHLNESVEAVASYLQALYNRDGYLAIDSTIIEIIK